MLSETLITGPDCARQAYTFGMPEAWRHLKQKPHRRPASSLLMVIAMQRSPCCPTNTLIFGMHDQCIRSSRCRNDFTRLIRVVHWCSEVPTGGDIRRDIVSLSIGEANKDLFGHLCNLNRETHPKAGAILKHLDTLDQGRYFRVPGDRYALQLTVPYIYTYSESLPVSFSVSFQEFQQAFLIRFGSIGPALMANPKCTSFQ